MIDGEIYVVIRNESCVFAFRDDGSGRQTTHYIGVTGRNEVKRYGDNACGLMYSYEGARLANDEQRERFKEFLERNDYYWNKENKKVIRISTGEVL